MEMLLICRNAQESSIIGNVAVAMEAKKSGQDVGVLFTEEALAALAGESMYWPPLFESRDARTRISRNATALGVEVSDVKDARWTDIPRLLKAAKDLGVALFICPIWSQILGVDGRVFDNLSAIDKEAMLKMLSETKTVVGGF
ncbi:MAG: hypothetical protein SVY53_10860 [Chloroflexota bacterium]|nr:hypothetical protein [Chloroflexota bacterium]